MKERYCTTCGGPILSAGANWCDYCHRLSVASWPSVTQPAPAAPAALAMGGKLALALVGGMFGFALVASNGLFGLIVVLLLYGIGLCVGGLMDAHAPALPVGNGLPRGGRTLNLPASLRYGSYLRLVRRSASQIEQVVRSGP